MQVTFGCALSPPPQKILHVSLNDHNFISINHRYCETDRHLHIIQKEFVLLNQNQFGETKLQKLCFLLIVFNKFQNQMLALFATYLRLKRHSQSKFSITLPSRHLHPGIKDVQDLMKSCIPKHYIISNCWNFNKPYEHISKKQ